VLRHAGRHAWQHVALCRADARPDAIAKRDAFCDADHEFYPCADPVPYSETQFPPDSTAYCIGDGTSDAFPDEFRIQSRGIRPGLLCVAVGKLRCIVREWRATSSGLLLREWWDAACP